MKALALALGIAALASAVFADNVHVPGSIPKNPFEPLQHRLAYAGPNGMTVSWNTYKKLEKPSVQYGADPFHLSGTSYGDSSTYPTSRTFSNHVTIKGLKSDTVYYYRVANTNCYDCAALPTYTFRTARVAGDHREFSVAVVVDLGVMGDLGLSDTVGTGAANPLGPNDTNTIQSILQYRDTYTALLHPGDLAYSDYWLKEEIQQYIPGYSPNNMTFLTTTGVELYETLLEQFYDEMQPVTSVKPYMTGPGNHEGNCDNGGTSDKANNITYTDSFCLEGQNNYTGYRSHFRMPGPESGGEGSMWYSWDFGLTHFVQIDTETDLGHGLIGPTEAGGSEGFHTGPFGTPNQQIDWLEKDLASVDRSKTPWVVVLAHRPYYVNGGGEDVVRQAFEPTLLKHCVDVVFFGHVHNYERMSPIANFQPDPAELNNPSAPWYIINGAGGHYDGLDPMGTPIANFSRVAFDDAFGWSRFTFHDASHLTHQFVASRNGSILDTATLYKEHSQHGCGKHGGNDHGGDNHGGDNHGGDNHGGDNHGGNNHGGNNHGH